MKLKAQMQKAKVLTIENGILQAQYNGVLFQDYDERFANIQFAGNAKQIFEAMTVLDKDFYCHGDHATLLMTDGFQEFNIQGEVPDKILYLSNYHNWSRGNTISFFKLRPFVTQDYPAYFCTKEYTEVIHPSMIVRGASYHLNAVLNVCDLSNQQIDWQVHPDGLFITLGDNASVCMGYLDIEKPNTDIYFKNFAETHPIPQVVKNRWVPCEWAKFTSDGLLLDERVLIEEVKGYGKYDGKLLAKVIKNCTYWEMDAELMYFKNDWITGVLENVRH